LRVVAHREGKSIGEAAVRTAGTPAAIRLSPDRVELNSYGDDLSYLLVEALDEHGVPCPHANDLVKFSITGPASLAGVGNGNPLSLEPFQQPMRELFHGKAMLIIRADGGPGGEIRVEGSAKGMKSGVAILHSSHPK
jgi:beta-galactosidase